MKKTIKLIGFTALVAVIGFMAAGCASMTVVDVEWDTLEGPAKTRQYLGISNSEVKVYAHYKNGDRKQASPSLSYNRDTAGPQTVTVRLGNVSGGSFQTEVMELTGIRMISAPTKSTYTVGDILDITGLKVMGSWRDMPEAEIPFLTLLLAKNNFNSTTPGNKVVSVEYKAYSVSFPVTVRPKPADAPAAAAPAASQPAAQQPAASQPAAQQPAQSTSTFNPAANQPAPTGRWRSDMGDTGGYALYTFNANGTGTLRTGNTKAGTESPVVNLTWSASGNRLTMQLIYEGSSAVTATYSISGNTMTLLQDGWPSPQTMTKQ